MWQQMGGYLRMSPALAAVTHTRGGGEGPQQFKQMKEPRARHPPNIPSSPAQTLTPQCSPFHRVRATRASVSPNNTWGRCGVWACPTRLHAGQSGRELLLGSPPAPQRHTGRQSAGNGGVLAPGPPFITHKGLWLEKGGRSPPAASGCAPPGAASQSPAGASVGGAGCERRMPPGHTAGTRVTPERWSRLHVRSSLWGSEHKASVVSQSLPARALGCRRGGSSGAS